MRPGDIASIRACLADPRFTLPYLTGTRDPLRQPVRPWWRSADYVLRAIASRLLGRLLFGARRHWIMAVMEGATGRFLGVVLLDGVVRFPRGERHGVFGSAFLETHKDKSDGMVGDAEWGFFLHPDVWGQGVALQAVYALTAALAQAPPGNPSGFGIVRRVWAETGADNRQATILLTKAGLIENRAKKIPASASPRFAPDGRRIELVHFEQPPGHTARYPASPVIALLEDMERTTVAPGWRASESWMRRLGRSGQR